jgi:ATP-dependent helicase IRC3
VSEVMLRDYQVAAREAVARLLGDGVRSLLTVLPTGTGKTLLFACEVADWAPRGRVLVLVHRDELVAQTLATLRRVEPALKVGVVKAERDEVGAGVVVASVQTLSHPRRLERYLGAGPRPVLLVTDEAHHAAAPTYRRIYAALAAGEPDGPVHLGYTATPERHDGAGLQCAFSQIAYCRDIRQMVEAGWLAEPRGRIVRVDIDLDAVRREHGDYTDAGLDEAMDDAAVSAIARAWWEHAPGRVTLAFTPSVRTAHMLASAAQALGARAEAVDGGTPDDERRDVLERLKAGALHMVANCAVLTEGFDAPNVDCVLVARPTQSESLYVQMVGRGLRLWPMKRDCLVLDVTGVSAQRSLCVLPVLFGLPPADMAGQSVSEVAEALAEAARRRGLRLADKERQVDLLRRRREWCWVEVEPGRVFAVSPGADKNGVQRMLIVRSLPDTDPPVWTAEVRTRSGLGVEGGMVLFAGHGESAAEDAFGCAETWLGSQPSARLLAGRTGWRRYSADQPATDAQRQALERWGVEVPAELTKGEASEMLTRAAAAAYVQAPLRPPARGGRSLFDLLGG